MILQERVTEDGGVAVLVHFQYVRHGDLSREQAGLVRAAGGKGESRVACLPGREDVTAAGGGHLQQTNVPQAVTCAACKESEEFKRASGGEP
jgi:hypothetical protein